MRHSTTRSLYFGVAALLASTQQLATTKAAPSGKVTLLVLKGLNSINLALKYKTENKFLQKALQTFNVLRQLELKDK